jgi:hypothetical protein
MLAGLPGNLQSWRILPVVAVCSARCNVDVRVQDPVHHAWEANTAQGVLLDMRYETARPGVEERSLVGSRRMIVAMLGWHIDQ